MMRDVLFPKKSIIQVIKDTPMHEDISISLKIIQEEGYEVSAKMFYEMKKYFSETFNTRMISHVDYEDFVFEREEDTCFVWCACFAFSKKGISQKELDNSIIDALGMHQVNCSLRREKLLKKYKEEK